MAADKLGSGVYHNIRAVFDWTDKVWGSKCVVNHQRKIVGMGDFSDGVDVRNVAVGIAQGFQIDCPGVGLDCPGDFLQIVGIHKGGADSVMG